MRKKEFTKEWISGDNITENDLIEYRKHNYWRGFCVALLILSPVVIILLGSINALIEAMIFPLV